MNLAAHRFPRFFLESLACFQHKHTAPLCFTPHPPSNCRHGVHNRVATRAFGNLLSTGIHHLVRINLIPQWLNQHLNLYHLWCFQRYVNGPIGNLIHWWLPGWWFGLSQRWKWISTFELCWPRLNYPPACHLSNQSLQSRAKNAPTISITLMTLQGESRPDI